MDVSSTDQHADHRQMRVLFVNPFQLGAVWRDFWPINKRVRFLCFWLQSVVEKHYGIRN